MSFQLVVHQSTSICLLAERYTALVLNILSMMCPVFASFYHFTEGGLGKIGSNNDKLGERG